MRRYRLNGYKLKHPGENPPIEKKLGRPLSPLDQHRDDLMASVYAWRFLSLDRRTEIIRQQWDINVSRNTLRDWYRRNGVVNAKPVYHISNRYTVQQMLNLQEDFSLKANRLWHRREIIFIDECSCSAWTKPGKTWIDTLQPFHLRLCPNRGSSV